MTLPLRIRPDTFGFTLVLGALAALPSLSIDMTAPTLPALQAALGASPTAAALTITLFMVGFALGQLGAGTLSDHHGRRPVLLAGLGGYVLAGLGGALAPSAGILVACRLAQGVAAGAGTVLAFAMVRDLYQGDVARAKRSHVSVIFSLAPMVAPTLGAWVLNAAGWRAAFAALPLAGLLLLVVSALGVAESRGRAPAGSGLSPRRVAAAYRGVLAEPPFRTPMLVNALSFASMFAYVAGSPFVFMGGLGLSASAYGLLFACTAGGLMAGAWASGRLSRRGVPANRLLAGALAVAAVSAVALAAASAAPVPVLAPLLVLHLFCRGLAGPNAQHMALEPMGERAGVASAAIGVSQILAGALASAAVALLLPVLGPLAMTGVMALLSVASFGVWRGAGQGWHAHAGAWWRSKVR